MRHFCVLGSVNMDLVTTFERFPKPGETLHGRSFGIFPGGKGANQAVALARLGARVEMVGAIGDDLLGANYEELFDKAGIGHLGVAKARGMATGTASIQVDGRGENTIVVVAGANETLSPSRVEDMRATIEGAAALLLQLEIPLESVVAAARIASKAGVPVILDPAPARPLPEELFPLISILTPNQTEAALLTGERTEDEAGIAKACSTLKARGVRNVIVKAGGRGAYLAGPEGATHVPGFSVKVVDTVAAGDSFNAGLALALFGDPAPVPGPRDLERAIRFAHAVAALSTTKEGAQSAMPDLASALGLFGRG
ncbi:MAG TPA: ribokinase [Rectinemataceae bacterium]|nr:ribokinase [Rectinemataceae bacterium]